jgi:type II secretory pathway component GspD/PulD (secretin)
MLRSATVFLTAALALAACAMAQESAPKASNPAPAADPNAKKPKVTREDRDQARKTFLDGAKDMEHNNPRAALEAFNRAAALDPTNRRFTLAAGVALQHLVRDLVQQADKDRILGHLADARAALAEAARLDPENPMVEQHAGLVNTDAFAAAPGAHPDDVEVASPIELRPKPGLQSFHLHTNQRDLIKQVLSTYGIQATVEESVGSQLVRYEVENEDFDQALHTLALTTNTFVVPLDPSRALVAKNTKDNHAKFDRLAVETVRLPGLPAADVTEMVTLAKDIFSAQTVTAAPGQNALTIRAPAANLTALNATLNNFLAGRGEIQLEVSMYEVDRTKATNIGMIIPTQTNVFNVYSEAASLLQTNSALVQQIISSGLAAPGDWEAILAILVASGQISNSILSQPFGVFGGGLTMTGINYQGGSVNLQLNSSSVHSVDQMSILIGDGEQGTLKVGERYPIETSSYSSLGGSSLNIPGLSSAGLSSTLQNLGINPSALASAATQAVPQVQYQDIGLELDVTPRIEGRDNLSLKFDLKLSSLAGSSVNGLPVLDNREYNAFTSLTIGESTVLVSTLSRQESDALTGIPGIADIPGFSGTTNSDRSFDYSQLAIVITPHLVRSVHNEFAEKMYLLPHNP